MEQIYGRNTESYKDILLFFELVMNKIVFRNIKQAVKICILVIQNILVYFLKTKLFGGRRDRRMGARFALDFAEKSDEY